MSGQVGSGYAKVASQKGVPDRGSRAGDRAEAGPRMAKWVGLGLGSVVQSRVESK